jgi:hypothetical protein
MHSVDRLPHIHLMQPTCQQDTITTRHMLLQRASLRHGINDGKARRQRWRDVETATLRYGDSDGVT